MIRILRNTWRAIRHIWRHFGLYITAYSIVMLLAQIAILTKSGLLLISVYFGWPVIMIAIVLGWYAISARWKLWLHQRRWSIPQPRIV